MKKMMLVLLSGCFSIRIFSQELYYKKQNDSLTIYEPQLITPDTLFADINSCRYLLVHSSKEKIIPSWLKNFHDLHQLEISYFQLESLPDWLKELTKLEVLSLQGDFTLQDNDINILKSLRRLKELELNDVGLSSKISDLTNLESLTVENIDEVKLPSEIKKLYNLKNIRISGGKRIDFQYLVEILPFTINHISIYDTQIDYIPCNIKRFRDLKTLSLVSCGINNIPECMKDLPDNMNNIILVNNNIADIPDIFVNKKWAFVLYSGKINKQRQIELIKKYPKVTFHF